MDEKLAISRKFHMDFHLDTEFPFLGTHPKDTLASVKGYMPKDTCCSCSTNWKRMEITHMVISNYHELN